MDPEEDTEKGAQVTLPVVFPNMSQYDLYLVWVGLCKAFPSPLSRIAMCEDTAHFKFSEKKKSVVISLQGIFFLMKLF